jgi:hypothetical protein
MFLRLERLPKRTKRVREQQRPEAVQAVAGFPVTKAVAVVPGLEATEPVPEHADLLYVLGLSQIRDTLFKGLKGRVVTFTGVLAAVTNPRSRDSRR